MRYRITGTDRVTGNPVQITIEAGDPAAAASIAARMGVALTSIKEILSKPAAPAGADPSGVLRATEPQPKVASSARTDGGTEPSSKAPRKHLWLWVISGVGCATIAAVVVAVVLWTVSGGTQDMAAVASNHTPPNPVPTARPMTANASESRQATEKVEAPYSQSKVGDTFTNSIGMNLTYIPAGEFVMGSPANEEGRDNYETQHRVRITKAFMMGTTEVTQAQWKAVMGNNPSHLKGDTLPVEQVSWHDAQEFCRKLSEKEGRKYRLPTEAEWEYACRAGTMTAFGGTGNLDNMGWYANNSGRTSHPVGQKQANAWGLYDMHGNVWEWCSDWYWAYPAGEPVDPAGAAKGDLRVLRGGSWGNDPGLCRSALRGGSGPGNRSRLCGFRVAVVSAGVD